MKDRRSHHNREGGAGDWSTRRLVGGRLNPMRLRTRRPCIVPLLATLFLAACATVPAGPSVMVLPGTGKNFEQFQADDAVCRQWAAQQTGTTPRRAATESTVSGAAIGTAVGAAAGGRGGGRAGRPAGVGAGRGGGGGCGGG